MFRSAKACVPAMLNKSIFMIKKRCVFFPVISLSHHKRARVKIFPPKKLLLIVGRLIAVIGCLLLAIAASADNKTLYRFELPEQDLNKSISHISNQAQTLILFPYELVENREGNAISGQYSALDALNKVLENSGLIALPSQSGALTISTIESLQLNKTWGKDMNTKKQLLASMIAFFMGGNSLGTVAQDKETEADGFLLEEVVVTAQKREQNIQDVPVAITAISADGLEKIGAIDVEGLYGHVPSLYFHKIGYEQPANNFVKVVMRGVGTTSGESAVGIYIDDVYQPALGFDIDFNDIERVEILRGPQGTLFGRNTLAGAIRLITKRPGDEKSGRVSLEYDEFNTIKGKGAVSGPLVEGELAASLSVQAETTDGYIDNTTLGGNQDDGDAYSARMAFLYTPTEDLDVLLSTDYFKSDKGILGIGVVEGCNCYDVDDDVDSNTKSEQYGLSMNIDWELPSFMFTSITGYRYVDAVSYTHLTLPTKRIV